MPTQENADAGRSRLRVTSSTAQFLYLVVLSMALWLVYGPGLAGPYIFDDYQNIGGNPYLAIDAMSAENLVAVMFSRSEGISSRPLSMLSFAFNYYFAGQSFNVFYFKLTNLVIHAANVALVFLLLRSLITLKLIGPASGQSAADLRRRAVLIAAFASGLWGLHPLQLTSVLYTVQRMNSLAAFFVLGGLLVFVAGRERFDRRPLASMAWMIGGLAGGVGLGFLCKENAILLPGFALVLELVFFDRATLSPARRRQLMLFYGVVLGLPALLGAAFLMSDPNFVIRTYGNREFGLGERLMTETRVLFFYISLIFYPLLSRFGVFHDDFELSTGLLAPVTTLFAVAAWLLILLALVPGLRRRAVWAFAIGWFLVGHLLESTILGLELVHEHRNYLPSLGVIAAAAFYAALAAERLRLKPKLTGVVALSTLLALGFISHARAEIWSTRLTLYQFEARNHPNSYRALGELAAVMSYQGADVRETYKAYRDAARVNPSTIYPLITMQRMIQAVIAAGSSDPPESGPSAGSNGAEQDWTADLAFSWESLLRNDAAVSHEISRRLNAAKPSTETISALQMLQGCAVGGYPECLRIIDRAIDWHQLTIRRLPNGRAARAAAELSLARIFAFQGDIDGALALVDDAIESGGHHPRLRIQKAILLAKLGRTEDAKRLAEEIEQHPKHAKMYAKDLELLRRFTK